MVSQAAGIIKVDMGFEMAGFEIIWTNEFDEAFAKFHAAGITSWRRSLGNGIKAEIFNTKSIIDVPTNEIITEAFPDGKPDTFGIIGGPPCQDFSTNGYQVGFEGERGKLTIIFFDRILDLCPTFFVMENVTGLTKSNSTKEHLKNLLKRIETKYYVDHNTLNSLDFGVPQHRECVFFIGIRKDVINKEQVTINLSGNWFPWPENKVYKNAGTKYSWPKPVPFGKSLTKPKKLPLELCVQSILVPFRETNITPNANEYFKLHLSQKKLTSIQEGETRRPSFKRLHRFKYSPTACYGNNEVHLHPYRHRRLSVREALRIQGVPDSYVLPAGHSLTKKFKMIGNGVPVPLAKAVASNLRKFLFDKKT